MASLLLGFLLAGMAPALVLGAGAPCPIERAAASGRHVWLLCERDELFVSADEGASWQARRLPPDVKYRAIALPEPRRGFVAGDGGVLLATEDGGETWRPVQLPTRENLTSIHFVGDLAWISGWSGVILHSADGGRTWVRQPSGVLQGLDCIYFADAKHGWAVGWVGTILRTVDGGRTWEQARTRTALWSLHAVYFRDISNGWAVGSNGQILRSDDGGLTWEEQASPVKSWLRSVFVDAAGRGWIAADEELLVSDDGGKSWRTLPVVGARFLHQLLPLPNSVWAIGRFGVLGQTRPGGDLRPLETLPQRGSSGA